jgi:hypothetical protein
MNYIIGLSGRKRSGKDTTFSLVQEIIPSARRYSIGDQIRIECALALQVPFDELNRDKEKFRDLLKWWGWYRRQSNPRYWVDILSYQIHFDNPPVAVITDLRYSEDVKFVKEGSEAYNSTVIWIDRPQCFKDFHPSESSLDSSCADLVINNDGTLDYLRAQVSACLEFHNIIELCQKKQSKKLPGIN